MSRPLYLILLAFTCFLPLTGFTAEGDVRPHIQRMEGQFVFDGIPDEEVWQAAEPFPMITHQPVFGTEPQEKTDIRILFDDQFVYVGASLYTSDPSKILNSSKKRDELKPDCDWVAVVFDSYNDNETGLTFWTTPSGLRTDMAVFNDAQGSMMMMPVNTSWNTHWDVKSQMNSEGWFSEMLIPVSSLKFQEKDGEVVMGLIVIRWIPQHDAVYIYPPIRNEYGDWSLLKVSMAEDVVFPGLKSKKPLYITPYALGGFSQLNELNDAKTSYEFRRERELNAGIDLKYGITSNLTMDLTLNTDFAQVEADNQMVNLTRFDLFFEEKRQFFLERASIFDFNTGGPTTMFYSRRIGLDDDGNIVPIIGGARFIGRKSGWDMGVLNMQTANSENLPSENFGVVRVKKRIFNEYSYAGGIYTSRLGMDGSFNHVYGIDGSLRLSGDEYIQFMWGQTFENGLANRPFSMENGRYRLNWQRRRDVGLYYDLIFSGTGPEYNPGIGFQNREDYHVLIGRFNYGWLAPEDSKLYKHGPGIEIHEWFCQSRNIREGADVELYYLLSTKSFWSIVAGPAYKFDYLFKEFELSDTAWVPPGQYRFYSGLAMMSTPMTKPVGLSLRGRAGEYYDGTILTFSANPKWSVSSSLTLSGTYAYNRVKLPVRNQQFIAHIARMKAELMFTTKLSVIAFIQYNSAAHIIGSNIRFRYNPREGNDLWLVYNEGTNTQLDLERPQKPRLAGRTVMLKYTYTFRL